VSRFDLRAVPLVDQHSHAGLYERRLGRHQSLADLDTGDPHYATSAYRLLLRDAYADLYGDAADWSAGMAAQYADGIEAAYTRMLDRLGIRATLWDYRRLARGAWPADRYRLIYWIDPFVCPFPDAALSRGDELQQALAEALALAGLQALPDSLEDYLAFVDATLQHARGALVGLKLLLGYHRPLHFEDVPASDAGRVYRQLQHGQLAEYAQFQDFMVRYLFRAAGALELPLQIHAAFGGPSSNLRLAHNDPSLLQPLFAQPAASRTRVVLLHGGYPFVSHAAALAWMYPHVYLDFSVLPSLFALPLARWLEEWLELLPHDKLLFGSDASSPELYYTAATNGRRQLARALEGLVASSGLTRREAVSVAERVLHGNAVALYGLSDLG
jgi:uncharacterized protein